MKEKKVLLFVDRMRVGGIQVLLVNLLEHFNQNEIQYDLLVLDDSEHYDLEAKAIEAGATIHKLDNVWVRNPQDYVTYCKAVDQFFQEHHDYMAVHINTGPKNYFVLKYAKKYGIPVRIAHSHNTGYQTNSKAQQILGNLFKSKLKKYATDYVACSQIAGEWMFGKDAEMLVLPNGVDLEKFQYRQEVRARVRKELGIEDAFVVGNVGRFTVQKNHTYLLEIFAELYRRNPKAVLLLAGIGETQADMEAKAKALGIEEQVKFLGFRTDVSDIIQGMDLFLMPSLYEGFPVTAVEAQCAGLTCVFSDTITREAKILENATYVSLEASVEVWASHMEEAMEHGYADRSGVAQDLKEKGFDIRDMAQKLEGLYKQGL